MKRLILLCAAASMLLTGCVSLGGKPIGTATRTEAITAVAQAGAAIADAQHVAPPASFMSDSVKATATIAMRDAFRVFDTSLDVVDAFVAGGGLVRNTPRALTVKHAINDVQVALNAASAAVKVGNSASYSEALAHAQTALAQITKSLKQ